MTINDPNVLPLFGPGSQPQEHDGTELDILQLPNEMLTYEAPNLPEPEDVQGMAAALTLLQKIQLDMQLYRTTRKPLRYDLRALDDANRHFVEQLLGEGEVSIVFHENGELKIQESALAGLWRIKGKLEGQAKEDCLQVGPVPDMIHKRTFIDAHPQMNESEMQIPAGVGNAVPLIAEINEHCLYVEDGHTPHVINLTLLPQSEADLDFLHHSLGAGKTHILSRGYGNCRISSTNTRNVWWVQYFNSQDKNILNTLEITGVPEAARAAQEDIADSAVRLAEILEIYN